MECIYEYVKNARDEYYSRNARFRIFPTPDTPHHRAVRRQPLYVGQKDCLKREKPLYNICKFRVNVAVCATDLDTKDVTIEADDEKAGVELIAENGGGAGVSQAHMITLPPSPRAVNPRGYRIKNGPNERRRKPPARLLRALEPPRSCENPFSWGLDTVLRWLRYACCSPAARPRLFRRTAL